MPVEFQREIACSGPRGGEKAKPIDLRTMEGFVFLNTHGEARLDRDQAIDLRRQLDAAFQAVA